MDILLIEPNRLQAQQYCEYLERRGHRLRHVQDAQAAVTETDRHTPDLVIMELLLAGHSGVEFLYEFRSYPEWQKVPVVIMSHLPEAEIPSSGRVFAKLGVGAYLYKPATSLKRLAERVEALIPSSA